MLAVAIPVATVLMFGSGLILRLYGRGFRGGEPVMIALIATTLIQCIGAVTGTAIEAWGKMWVGLLLNCSWAFSYLGFVYLTVTRLGANSLAFGLFLSYTCVTLLTLFYLESRLPLPPGMLKRSLFSILLTFALAVFVLISSAPLRLLLLVPATLIATLLTFSTLVVGDFAGASVTRRGKDPANCEELQEYAEPG
jgi:O-antigen/teichoic acid export membrane protein